MSKIGRKGDNSIKHDLGRRKERNRKLALNKRGNISPLK